MSYKAKLVAAAAAPEFKMNPLAAAGGGGKAESDDCSTSSENSYAEPEFFKIKATTVLEAAMNLHTTDEYIDNWLPVQQLYHQNRSAWTIVGHIHQRDADDQPHLSVYYKTINTGRPIFIYYHIYGFIKNSFTITHITRQNKDKTTPIVAEFAAY